jgi:PAS domain S-box-containing protein
VRSEAEKYWRYSGDLSNPASEAGRAILLAAAPETGDPYYRQVLDCLPAAIYVTDALGRITYYNDAAAALWGHRPPIGTSEWCGSWKLFWPDGRPLPHGECPMAMAIKERRPIRGIEAVAERPDGTRVPFMPYPNPLYDASGQFIGAVNMLVETTDRRQADELKQRLAGIVQFSDDAIISKNLDGIIQTWNGGAERIFGYTADEAIGQPVTLLFPPDRVDEEPAILSRVRRGERIEHYETVRRRKDGGLINVSLTVSPIADANGKIVGASKIARDVTERHKAQEQRELHFREMDHRIRNLFSLAQSVVTLSGNAAQTPKEVALVARDRLAALARAHALTLPRRVGGLESNEEHTTLQTLVRTIFEPYEAADLPGRVVISGSDISIAPRVVHGLALALHEFATNSAKYGALSTPDGQIQLMCAETDGHFSLVWTECGGPPVSKEPDVEGFGSQLARATIAGQLGGEFSREWRSDGLIIRLSLPRHRLT